MRVAVLPREVAARVTTSAVARGAWVVNASSLVLTIPILIGYLAERDLLGHLPVPLSILVAMVLLATAAAIYPRPALVMGFVVVGAVGAVVYQLLLIAADPATQDEAVFLLNRPAVSLVLIGVANTTTLMAVAWTAAGFLLATAVPIAVGAIAAVPFRPGWGALLIFLFYATSYLVLAQIQARLRRRVPDFDALEEETRRLGLEENLRQRIAATVHDTLLNDLAIVMSAPDELDERVVARLRADIATLRDARWRDDDTAVEEQDVELRNRIMMLMSDLQWRGLTVQVTGTGTGVYRLAPHVATAMLEAVRACLENVLRHSGTDVAEVDVGYSASEITVIVTDQGVGFDPAAVPSDRLGLRESIEARVRSVGGTAKIWSTPGAGTSVVMSFPIVKVVREHPESTHARS